MAEPFRNALLIRHNKHTEKFSFHIPTYGDFIKPICLKNRFLDSLEFTWASNSYLSKWFRPLKQNVIEISCHTMCSYSFSTTRMKHRVVQNSVPNWPINHVHHIGPRVLPITPQKHGLTNQGLPNFLELAFSRVRYWTPTHSYSCFFQILP